MDEVVVDGTDLVGSVRLNRPHRGNSVTPAVVTELGEAVQRLCDTDSVRAVVITGTGPVFCAGADVREMHDVYDGEGPDGLMDYLADVWMPAVQRTVRSIWGAPKPIVAAFNGAATAGGLDFGLACDTRVAASTARFAESYVNLGMVPVAGGAFLLPLVAGLPAATTLLASGAFVDAARALELGIVSEVCAPEELDARARQLASDLAHGPAETFVRVKRIARGPSTPAFEVALRESLEANIALIARPEVRKRILSVMERFSLSSR
ncbi:enoyl-CoA hydratase/isomerase family protein [Streptomyces sp. NBC_01775]|uniref:enoyl-CoA hydratase/isomerase family protein n=1 Tax=Streptomyces sp. NBC_01775 TaxID=2975939 RepID=UPI002DDB83D7|nr:enoyl-CoA hydratase/isomerase family protein [Streptomyces sp. NBC_01775]WSB74923.1 enoyl-CoA hydratase/isomerase family protein [Streptomyces sp. NBC_01775]